MLPKSKVLILKFPYQASFGGPERQTLKVFTEMNKRGLDFLLLASCPVLLSEFRRRGWRAERWWAGLEPKSLGAQILLAFSWPLILLSLFSAILFLRFYGYNKIYCLSLTEKIILTPFARLLGYKVIWAELLSPQENIFSNPCAFLYRAWSEMAQLVAVSFYVKRELVADGLLADQIEVIYDGVDPEIFKKQQSIFELLAEKNLYPIEQFRFRLGFIGQLSEIKGIHILLQALAKLKSQIPEFYLTIIGEGRERARLEWLVKELALTDQVKLVGYQEDWLNWLWNFDVVILPSLIESLGITAIEAMAGARPVIVSNVGGLPEAVENNVSGLVVEPNDSDALAAGIAKLYNDKNLAQQLGLTGREQVQKKFNLRSLADAYWRVFVA